MVVAQPDVPDAFVHVLSSLIPHRDFAECELMSRRLLAENCGRGFLPMSETKQPFVLRIQIEQQSIVGLKRLDGSWTDHRKEQDGVGSVGVVVDHMTRCLRGAAGHV